MGVLRELVKPHPSKQFSQVIPFHRGQVMSAAMFDITLSPAARERDEIKLLKPSSFDQLTIGYSKWLRDGTGLSQSDYGMIFAP
jgi:hypothetical protein